MGDDASKPTVMINIGQTFKANKIMNFYSVMAGGVGISASFYEFASTQIPELKNLKAIIFVIYYGLIMAW